jgi:muramidase (phage lysozyme)
MSDSREWPFNSSDLLKIPFIFVPDGDPVPTEWLASHPDAIRIRARFVPTGNSGSGGGGALQADLNDAMMQWLGRAAGDDGTPGAPPDQAGGQISPQARLADLLAASASGAGNPSEMNLDPALNRFLYPTDEDAVAPSSHSAARPAANGPGRGEGSPTGTTLDPALMKFILGTYGDHADGRPQTDQDSRGTLPATWPADWQPTQNGRPGDLPNPTPEHASSETFNPPATPANTAPKKMTPEEMLKLARMRAMLRLIRSDENNGASDDKAYHARYGNRDPMSDKDMINYVPKDEKFINKKGKLEHHTTAGAYEILKETWQEVSRVLGIKDFTPANQDIAAIHLINKDDAARDIEAGNLAEAIRKLNYGLPSLPGGSQSHTKLEVDTRKFDTFVADELRRMEEHAKNAKP